MSKLAGLTSALRPENASKAAPRIETTPAPAAPAPAIAKKPRPLAKSQDPEWERMHPFARIKTRRDAVRRFQDAGGKDESDLIEGLLAAYAAGKVDVPSRA